MRYPCGSLRAGHGEVPGLLPRRVGHEGIGGKDHRPIRGRSARGAHTKLQTPAPGKKVGQPGLQRRRYSDPNTDQPSWRRARRSAHPMCQRSMEPNLTPRAEYGREPDGFHAPDLWEFTSGTIWSMSRSLSLVVATLAGRTSSWLNRRPRDRPLRESMPHCGGCHQPPRSSCFRSCFLESRTDLHLSLSTPR